MSQRDCCKRLAFSDVSGPTCIELQDRGALGGGVPVRLSEKL
jgi:hypothetical protein